MLIAIDASPLLINRLCGIKKYAINIINNLAKIDKTNKYLLFSFNKVKVPNNKNFKNIVIKTRLPFLKRQLIMPLVIKKYKPDVIHFLEPTVPLLLNSDKIVTTIHDTNLRGTFPIISKQFVNRIYSEFSRKISYFKTNKFIAISKFTKHEMVINGINESLISVIYYGLNQGFSPQNNSTNNSGKYFLTIGDFSPRKNLVNVINAYSQLEKPIQDRYSLIIVLSTILGSHKLKVLASSLGIQSKVDIIENVHQEKLSILYRNASLFLYPSLYEGFGMPILEAMSSGCPVITSEFGAMKEIAGKVAILVDPQNPLSIKNAIVKIINNNKLTKKLIGLGVKHVKKFNWENTAKKTIEVYKNIHSQNL